MNKQEATALIRTTFEKAFDETQYLRFLRELFNGQIDESDGRKFDLYGQYIPDSFKDYVRRYKRLGTYTDPDGHEIDLLLVILRRDSSLDRARTMQRNFAAYHLKRRDKETALIAYTTEDRGDWRFSMVRREPVVAFSEAGKLIAKDELTPVRRYSFLVGANERSHTAQQQFFPILLDDKHDPTLDRLEDAFNIETVTQEFFERYKARFLQLKEELDRLTTENNRLQTEFQTKALDTANFAKKLLGQIVFLYFLQKKGWLGVQEGEPWGTGPRNFLHQLFKEASYNNFFNDVLEPLFYEALAIERPDNLYPRLKTRIPFLNGGLFEPMNNYDWQHTALLIDNNIFKNIFEDFDLYNFTVREDEPLEKEVAVDPEMLGKVFENLLDVTDRKSKGAFYTPREIVHYMCQESLINYLTTTMGDRVPRDDIAIFIRLGEFAKEHDTTTQAKAKETEAYSFRMPESIRTHATQLDEALANIKICDPAIGSGAFPVGMMQEIIKAREVLTTYIGKSEDRTTYNFKRQAIQESIYGVDIDPGAIDIAKLRLWLSLVVDEDDYHHIKPLPNLDYKIVCGNSLLGYPYERQGLEEFEKLKARFFDETSPQQKDKLRKEIEQTLNEIYANTLKSLGYQVTVDFRINFSEVFRENGGFDVVIANPPYVGEKGNKEIFHEIARGTLSNFYQGKMDLFYFFFHLALNHCRTGGIISFITTSYFLTANSAKKLRADLKKRSIIHNFLNFNELKIFESALGQHNMITILQRGSNHNTHSQNFLTKRRGTASAQMLTKLLSGRDEYTDYYQVPQPDIFDGDENYIRIGGLGNIKSHDITNVILGKMKLTDKTLVDVCNVDAGLHPGVDRISKKILENYPNDGYRLNEGVFILSQNESIVFHGKSYLKSLYKSSDIQKYYIIANSYYILYSSPHKEIVDHLFEEHISRYDKVLRDVRARNNENLDSWKYLRRGVLNDKIYSAIPKIVVPYRAKNNRFAYTEAEFYGSQDVYFITNKENNLSLKYIISLLNSKLYFFWLYYQGKRKGETLEMYKTPLSEIPIRQLNEFQQKPFIELADKIIAIKQKNHKTDTNTIQQQIDQMVYALYQLTPEEIAAVENLYPNE